MKKILCIFSLLIILSGCSLGKMDNTPTKQVEKYLNNYQTLDSNVLTKLDSIVDQEILLNDDQKGTYRDILKKHYQDLTYKIKEETVNGDKATVEVEIEVNDYTRVLKEVEAYKIANESEFQDENGVYDEFKYQEYRLQRLNESNDRITYTIYFSLTKENDEWKLDSLSQTDEDKILGIYEY